MKHSNENDYHDESKDNSFFPNIHSKFTLFIILIAFLGGFLTQIGYNEFHPEKECSDDDLMIESIGKTMVIISSCFVALNVLIFLGSLFFQPKKSLPAFILLLFHVGGLCVVIFLFGEAIFSNIACGITIIR